MTAVLPILLATGLTAEARIAEGPGVAALAGGGDSARLAFLIETALAGGVRAVVSFGIAGGLAPGLAPGAVVVGRAVHCAEGRLVADLAWTERLAAALPDAALADLVGVEAPVVDASGKAALRARTGAAAVDMESHVAARLAARHGLPFAALRVVADPAERTLPPAALVGMRPDGTTDVGAVLGSLARAPWQLPALVRTGLDARAAFSALAASRRALTPVFDAGRAPHPTPLADVGAPLETSTG